MIQPREFLIPNLSMFVAFALLQACFSLRELFDRHGCRCLPLIMKEIESLIPHRSPFLYIDQLISYTPNEIVGVKTFSVANRSAQHQ